MSDKTTLIVTAVPNPAEMPSVQAYLQGVMPLFMGAGGQLVRRLKTTQVLDGRPAGMVLVMDFDSADAITGLFESDDYQALLAVRDQGFTEMNVLVTQGM